MDAERCQGHTLCAMIAPEVFELREIDGHATVPADDIAPGQQDDVREAVRSCPERALRLTD